MSAAKLLKLLAAAPPGDKLPLSRFARELAASTSVVAGMVERLVADGKLDRATLRPPSAAVAPPKPTSGDELIARVVEVALERGISKTSASQQIFGHNGQLNMLAGHEVRAATRARVEAWLAAAPAAIGKEPAAALEHAAPPAPLPEPKLPPVGRSRPRKNNASPALLRERLEELRESVAQRRESVEQAHASRAPGETVADRLRRIAAETAAEDDEDVGTLRPAPPCGVSTPSDLIRKAQAEWPGHVAAIAAIASEEGLSRGEAWRRVIAAGIDCLREGGSA